MGGSASCKLVQLQFVQFPCFVNQKNKERPMGDVWGAKRRLSDTTLTTTYQLVIGDNQESMNKGRQNDNVTNFK